MEYNLWLWIVPLELVRQTCLNLPMLTALVNFHQNFEGLMMLYSIIIHYNLHLRTIVILVHYSADGEV